MTEKKVYLLYSLYKKQRERAAIAQVVARGLCPRVDNLSVHVSTDSWAEFCLKQY